MNKIAGVCQIGRAIAAPANQDEPRPETRDDGRAIKRCLERPIRGWARLSQALAFRPLGCRGTDRVVVCNPLRDQNRYVGGLSETFVSYPLARGPISDNLVEPGCVLHIRRPGGFEFVAPGKKMCGRWGTRCQGGQCLRAGAGVFLYFPDVSCGQRELCPSSIGRHFEVVEFAFISELVILLPDAVSSRLAVRLHFGLLRSGAHGPGISGFISHGRLRGSLFCFLSSGPDGLSQFFAGGGLPRRHLCAGHFPFPMAAELVLPGSTVHLARILFLNLVLLGGLTALAWRRQFYAAWTWILPFAFTSFLLLTNINYPIAANFRNLFLLGLTLPHYFTGELFLAVALLFVAKLYRHWLPRGSLLWLDGINFALIVLSLIDLRLSQIMRVRFDWQAVIFGGDIRMVWMEAKPFLPETFAALIFLLVLYALILGLWQRGPTTKSLKLGTSGWFLIAAFLSMGSAGSWIMPSDKAEGVTAVLLAKSTPLVKWMTNPIMGKKKLMDTARQLGMEQMLQRPAGSTTRPSRRLNVVLIFQESSYNKYLSLFNGKVETQPLLSLYKDRMELFPNFFSNFAASINSRFATFSGLYPVRDYKKFTLDRVNVKSLFDILSGNDYQCSLFYSSYLDYTGFR
ncbi:MAG: sulfatase-like hydrolase/transferase, partial [Verrucomicrobiota bacterium]